jgi:hypothetical protein
MNSSSTTQRMPRRLASIAWIAGVALIAAASLATGAQASTWAHDRQKVQPKSEPHPCTQHRQDWPRSGTYHARTSTAPQDQ